MNNEVAVYDFSAGPAPYWRRFVTGHGVLEATGPALRLLTADADGHTYSNAQIDDYQGRPRRRFPWQPPLRLTVHARFSHPINGQATGLRGTAGFGFWNDPFLMTGRRTPTLPRAAWFFAASPPSNIKLDLQVPGWGWKAAVIDALRPAALLWALLAPPAVLAMNLYPVYRRLWPSIQRALRVREAEIGVEMTAWHTYVLDWGVARAGFRVDGRLVLDAPAPRGPLGFVMWLDNQYLVATPWGRFRWGLLAAPGRQWLEVDRLAIEPGTMDRRNEGIE